MTSPQDLVDTTAEWPRCVQPLLDNFCVTNDDSKQVIEIMCDSARKSTHSFHFLHLAKLLFELLPVGDVTIYDDELFDQALLVNNGASHRLQDEPVPILVAHSLLHALTNPGPARLGSGLLDLFPIVGMNLFEACGSFNLVWDIAEDFLVRWAVVEPLATDAYNRDHVSGALRNEPKKFLAYNQLFANLLHLEMLVHRIDVEEKNHCDQSQDRIAHRGRVERW